MADLDPNYPENRKKSKILTSSIVLALTAIIIILLCLWCGRRREALTLDKEKLTAIRERDSLAGEVRKIQDQVVMLQGEKDNLTQSLEKEGAEKKQLINDRSACDKKVKNSDKIIAGQKERINSLLGKNDSLFAIISNLQQKMDELNRKIAESEKLAGNLNSNIDGLKTDIQGKEGQISQLSDSIITEHKADSVKNLPVFVTIGELSGGLGLSWTNVPYSRNFEAGSILFGMEFNKRFLAGIGAGVDFFNGGPLYPLFLEFRYGFPVKKFTPYVFSQGGALINTDGYALSNLFLNAGIGLRRSLSKDWAISFGTGLFSHNSGQSGRDSFINFKLGLIYTKSKVPPK